MTVHGIVIFLHLLTDTVLGDDVLFLVNVLVLAAVLVLMTLNPQANIDDKPT